MFFPMILDLTEIQCDMFDVNSKYEKLWEVLRERQESLQTVFSRMEEVQKEASSVLQWLESKEEVLKAMDATLSPTKTETVKAQAESNKVLCFHCELHLNRRGGGPCRGSCPSLGSKPEWSLFSTGIGGMFALQNFNIPHSSLRDNSCYL